MLTGIEAAQTYYGTPAWNCYWGEINGNASVIWEDAPLDPAGVTQAAVVAHNFWQHEIDVQKIPTPQSYYVSPLTRCLQTANYTYEGLSGLVRPFIPTVKEYLREGISIHTCDHRSNKTYIEHAFPSYIIEPNFQEYDIIWNGVTSETNDAQNVRSLTVLDEIFSTDASTYISITTHSGEGASLLEVLGHIPFSLNTGAIIPVLVKAETTTIWGSPTPTTTPAWTPSPHCTKPPLSTDSAGNCVCVSATPVTQTLVNDVAPASTTQYHLSAYTEGPM